MEKSKILLIRHGFSLANNVSWNKQTGLEKKLGMLSYDENVPLADYGILQAKETGEFLSNLFLGKKILFIVSPYQRTKETMENILKQFNSKEITVDIIVDETIREIDAGIHFAKTKDELQETYPEEYGTYLSTIENLKEFKNKSFIPFIGGEGQQDVRRRVHHFSKKLDKMASEMEGANLKYDYICVVSHNFVNQWIYYWLNDKKELNIKGVKNCEVIIGNGEDAGKSLFIPETFVPKGYFVDLEKYQQKAQLLELKNMIDKFKDKKEIWKTLLNDDVFRVMKNGFELYIPKSNTDEYGCFLVDSFNGHDSVAYDSVSTHVYYILDGAGTFEINGRFVHANTGDVIKINPNEVFYYSGKMKMIEEIVPNFNEKNFHIVESINYNEIPNQQKKVK